jgi:hypothetical protein
LDEPVHLEEGFPREVAGAVAGVPGGPPARREVAGPGDPSDRGCTPEEGFVLRAVLGF